MALNDLARTNTFDIRAHSRSSTFFAFRDDVLSWANILSEGSHLLLVSLYAYPETVSDGLVDGSITLTSLAFTTQTIYGWKFSG